VRPVVGADEAPARGQQGEERAEDEEETGHGSRSGR
jgi:hypothetical protein